MDWNNMDYAIDQPYTFDFDHYYISYPLSHISKNHLESGNKIIMPQSALEHLTSLDVSYPMLFRIGNTATGLYSHCGVVEFTADEGLVFMPTWMMDNLKLQEGELVNIKNVFLPKGKYMKIQPHVTKFITLSDHKTLLEKAFRDFACLTTGDTILVNHGDEKYMVDILETKPSLGISLYETDCEVDFAPPLDYKEPEKKRTDGGVKRKSAGEQDQSTYKEDHEDTKVFPGVGRRLDGMQEPRDDNCCVSVTGSLKKLKITDSKVAVDGKQKNKHVAEFKPFNGAGRRVDGQSLAAVNEEEVEQDHSNVQVNVKERDEGFKVFTGKSYRLA